MWLKKLLFVLPLLLWVQAGCDKHSAADQSQVTGLVSPVAMGMRPLPVPSPKSQPQLKLVAQALQRGAALRPRASISGIDAGQPARTILARSYLQAVRDVGGLPRSQGEEVVQELVDGSSTSCGGASCSLVFGLKKTEVSDFFDELWANVVSDPNLIQLTDKTIRDLYLGSLKKNRSNEAVSAEAQDALAYLYEQKRLPWPKKPQQAPRGPSYRLLSDRMGPDGVRAIHNYTAVTFDWIREVETMSDPQLIARGMPQRVIDSWRKEADVIHQSLQKVAPLPVPVYRGIRNVAAEEIGQLILAWKTGKPIGLGPGNKPSLTSASWDPGVAERFVKGLTLGPFRKHFGVLYVIKGHRGVSIQEISLMPEEKEVLIPRNHVFKIDHIAPLGGERKIIMMELTATSTGAAP